MHLSSNCHCIDFANQLVDGLQAVFGLREQQKSS